jgi:hypothetical protein
MVSAAVAPPVVKSVELTDTVHPPASAPRLSLTVTVPSCDDSDDVVFGVPVESDADAGTVMDRLPLLACVWLAVPVVVVVVAAAVVDVVPAAVVVVVPGAAAVVVVVGGAVVVVVVVRIGSCAPAVPPNAIDAEARAPATIRRAVGRLFIGPSIDRRRAQAMEWVMVPL